jgi:FkbM family methyltransferase
VHHRLKQLRKLLRLVGNPVFRRGVRHGVGASVEHAEVLRGLDLATVLDVGANVGQFSLLAVAMFPRVRIEAFEPLSVPAGTFRRVFDGDARVRIHQVAIGARSQDQVTMNVSNRHDSSSMLRITDRQTHVFPGTQSAGTESVRMVTLDSVIDLNLMQAPALMKIDVQGFELEVLKGARQVLRHCEYVYAEVSFEELYEGQALAPEVIAFLNGEGFGIGGVHNVEYDADGHAVQCDMLFRAGEIRSAEAHQHVRT